MQQYIQWQSSSQAGTGGTTFSTLPNTAIQQTPVNPGSGSTANASTGSSPASQPHQKPNQRVTSSGTNQATMQGSTPTATDKFLLWCVNSKPRQIRLAQVLVRSDTKDRELFETLRTEYHKIRGWRARIFSIRDIGGIRFVKVNNDCSTSSYSSTYSLQKYLVPEPSKRPRWHP
jgi:hypothetical protein